MNKFIISDASPLIAFGRINRIELLVDLLGTILIPQVVAKECLYELSRPGAIAIKHAIDVGQAEVKENSLLSTDLRLLDSLGAGERAAISLALTTKHPLLIDERLGRNVAKKLGVKIIGTAGVLLLAKQKKIVSNIQLLLIELQQSGYRLAPELIKEILLQAKEIRDA